MLLLRGYDQRLYETPQQASMEAGFHTGIKIENMDLMDLNLDKLHDIIDKVIPISPLANEHTMFCIHNTEDNQLFSLAELCLGNRWCDHTLDKLIERSTYLYDIDERVIHLQIFNDINHMRSHTNIDKRVNSFYLLDGNANYTDFNIAIQTVYNQTSTLSGNVIMCICVDQHIIPLDMLRKFTLHGNAFIDLKHAIVHASRCWASLFYNDIIKERNLLS